MTQKLNVYAEGTVTLYHSELDATMDVPEEAVEMWKASGWKKATAKQANEAANEEEE